VSDLTRGCVVRMKETSGLVGYGNEQCVSSVCEPLGTLSLFGHNQHYKIYDVAEIVERPLAKDAEIARLDVMIKDANDVLRSAAEIAQRNGDVTDWDAFRSRLAGVLLTQHKYLYPEAAAGDKP